MWQNFRFCWKFWNCVKTNCGQKFVKNMKKKCEIRKKISKNKLWNIMLFKLCNDNSRYSEILN